MDIAKRLSFLDQAQTLLNEVAHEKCATNCSIDGERKLNNYFGFLSKEIRMKNRNVRFINSDPLKYLQCKRCYLKFSCFDINDSKSALALRLKVIKKKQYALIKCPQCQFERKVIFKKEYKTQLDKLLATGELKPEIKRPKTSTSKEEKKAAQPKKQPKP